MLLGMDGIGLWPAFSDWKRQLVMVNEQVAHQYGQAAKPIWDFAVVNDLTTEWLPEDPRLPAPKNGMQWFWDPAHPKPALGDLVQERVFISFNEDIGKILRPDTIDSHVQQQTVALHDYMKNDPATVNAIQKRLESLNTWHWVKH